MRGWVVLVSLLTLTLAERATYHGYKVYQVTPTAAQVATLSRLEGRPGFDFWTSHRKADSPVMVMVAPEEQSQFRAFLRSNRFRYRVTVHDVQTLLDAERNVEDKQNPAPREGKISFDQYYRHDEINAYLGELATLYPDLVTLTTLGQSTEGRDVIMIQISSDPGAGHDVMWIDAGIHAREWIAPAMALYVIQQLVENSTNSYLLDRLDWHILPVVNPDGYEFSHTDVERRANRIARGLHHRGRRSVAYLRSGRRTPRNYATPSLLSCVPDEVGHFWSLILNRLWRKTRSYDNATDCYGVDGNRNFEHHWNEGGSSDNPCNLFYHGPAAFSEPETRAIKGHLDANRDRIKLFITVHCFGQLFLYPWGYTEELPENWEELDSLAWLANNAQVAAGGESYEIGQSTQLTGMSSGDSDDYAMGSAGIGLAYTIELPGGGVTGFDMPPSEILPTVTPFFEAFRAFGEYLNANSTSTPARE